MTDNDIFLQVSGLSKSFAGVNALNDVSFSIRTGEIRCLVGENGSGKSTLIKTIAGVHAPDAGSISIAGRRYERLRPIDSIREGIQIIYQDFSLFPNLSVAENIALNYQLARSSRFVNWREVRQIARSALEQIDIRMDLDAPVGQLSVADKQLIAISRALLQNARLIIMDEPTTALTEKEVASLFKVIRTLEQRGIAILFVSHKLDEVISIAEAIMVLRNGQMVIDAPAAEFDQSKLVYYMTGQHIEEQGYSYQPQGAAAPLLRVSGLGLKDNFADISFDLHPGEILGITGLLGSGRTELAQALFGVHPADSGQIEIAGQPATINSIQAAIRHGIGYVPEDRLTEGLFLPQSIGRNMVMRTLDGLRTSMGLLDKGQVDAQIAHWVKALNIKTENPQNPARSLSGGNQQRVVIAKWLASQPRILILNGPTVGVDIGSKSELHETIKGLARQGIGIIIISDDIPELMNTCSRILLMRKGRIVEQFETANVSSEQLSEHLRQADAAN